MSWPTAPVTVRVPASSANLGPGFDSFGLALALHDIVEARVTQCGVDVQVTGMGAQTAQAGEQHLVIRSMRAAFDIVGSQPAGIALSCLNAVPHGFGLGSSAAAIVAGLLAARELAGDDGYAALPDSALLQLATGLEGHPDNVAACLAGGLTIAWRSAETVELARLEPLRELAPVVFLPAAPLATKAARQVLPGSVSHADAVANSARTALLVAALTSRPDLLLAGTEDFLHQRYRAAAMPAAADLIAALRAAGVAATFSGAGPAVLALPTGANQAAAAAGLGQIAETEPGWQVLPLRIDLDGALVLTGAAG